MKQGMIAGPYDPLYPEVTRKLRDDVPHYPARWIYLVLVSLFPVEEDWGDDPIWASGAIRVNKIDIARESGVGWKGFSRYWRELLAAGLVQEREDGLFLVPFYKKKAYDAISAREVRERLSRLEGMLTTNGPDQDEQAPEKDRPEKDDNFQTRDDHPSMVDDHPLIEDSGGSAILLKGLKEQSEEEEEEAKSVSAAKSGGRKSVPGSREWIVHQIDELWPGRGFKPESDGEYLEELEKFSCAELDAAFARAQSDKANYGNFDYLLNFLRNPTLYDKKRVKSRQRKPEPKPEPEGDAGIGTLKADWLDAE